MAVVLTLSKTLTGGAISDSLSGGSSGLDLGQVINSEYSPILAQGSNTGHQDIYASHNATIDEIQDYKTYIAQMSGSYGGADSAANDISTVIAKGQADNEATANNGDGLASGFRIEHNGFGIGGLGLSAFLPSRAQVDIYGNSGTDGIDLASAFNLHVDAMVYDNATVETDASAPVTGQIGIIGDSVLGDHMHVGVRFYLENLAPNGGIVQYDWVHSYSFTA